MLWQALLSEVLNLWILLPENNLLSGLFSWLVGLLVDSEFFPTNSIVVCALRSQSDINYKILYSESSQVLHHR